MRVCDRCHRTSSSGFYPVHDLALREQSGEATLSLNVVSRPSAQAPPYDLCEPCKEALKTLLKEFFKPLPQPVAWEE